MKPGTPLSRSTPLARGSKSLRGRRRPKPSLAPFHAAVTEQGACALAYEGGCGGRLEPHHYIPKQRLKGDEAAYVDPRNGVPLCTRHHGQVEWRRIDCPRPPYLDEFLADYGLVERAVPVGVSASGEER